MRPKALLIYKIVSESKIAPLKSAFYNFLIQNINYFNIFDW